MRFLINGAAVALLAAAGVTPALAEDAPGGTLVPGVQLAQMPPPPPMLNWTGFYVGVNGGYGFSESRSNHVFETVGTAPGNGLFGPPFIAGTWPGNGFFGSLAPSGGFGGGQFGYNWQFPNNWVLGFEADAQGADISDSAAATLPYIGGGNAIAIRTQSSIDWFATYRARLGYAMGPWLPFVTVGGAAVGTTQKLTMADTFGFTAKSTHTETKATWTGGGGLEYMFSPNLSAKLEYLFVDVRPSLISANEFVGGALTAFNVRTNPGSGLHTIRVGLNYHFAPAPPPPAPAAMPAPPPAAPKVFIVFFDWDKDSITPEGRQIIAQAADAYKSGAPVQIQVTGYTDRSGSPGYNQRLSERRANNVAKALAALGVPPAQMAVSGRGENDNRVPTANGVREPQNRRVEIVTP